MERYSARVTRSNRSRRRLSSTITSWSPTTSQSSWESTPSSQCHSRSPPKEWSGRDCSEALTEGRISVPTARLSETASSSRCCLLRRLVVGIAKRSKIVMCGTARWKRLKVASAARLASTSKSSASSSCSTSLSQFSLLGEYFRAQHPYRLTDYAILSF